MGTSYTTHTISYMILKDIDHRTKLYPGDILRFKKEYRNDLWDPIHVVIRAGAGLTLVNRIGGFYDGLLTIGWADLEHSFILECPEQLII